ncbi:MAG: dephospho-CoA kinase [Corallococcus sp.]|nr:dephospho-CoA kinase [Corallococcus sp.]MCM1359250.1 dephospho-CoA kinase [Corallococcus sp.]MCM1394641.1 dephospho-CoA kinase [Corallococcus sp.]
MKRRVVALTGGIGSGKSTVGNILRSLGFDVLDCDEIARKVETTPEVLEGVERLLGKEYVENGLLARRKIRDRIFADGQLYRQYSALFWEKIAIELKKQTENIRTDTVFVEIAVPDAFYFDWTEIWRVESSEENRICRVTARDAVSLENVKNIISRQNCGSSQNIQQIPHKVIYNDGSLSDLRNAVCALIKVW